METDDELYKILHSPDGFESLSSVNTKETTVAEFQSILETLGITEMDVFIGNDCVWDVHLILTNYCDEYLRSTRTKAKRTELDRTLSHVYILNLLQSFLTDASAQRYDKVRSDFADPNQPNVTWVPPAACLTAQQIEDLATAAASTDPKSPKRNWIAFFEECYCKYPIQSNKTVTLKTKVDTILGTNQPSVSTVSSPRSLRNISDILSDANITQKGGDDEMKKIVDNFDTTTFLTLTSKEDRQGHILAFINDAINQTAVTCPERLRLIFCLSNPTIYGRSFPTPTIQPLPSNAPPWNGKQATFARWHERIIGLLGMRGMTYIADSEFKATYRKYPDQKVIAIVTDAGFAAHLTQDRLTSDSAFVSAALVQLIESPTVKATIKSALKSNDGILAIYMLEDKYLYGLDTNFAADDNETIINEAYDNEKKSLRAWLDAKILAFSEMDTLNPALYPTDKSKIDKLCNKLTLPSLRFDTSEARQKPTFELCVQSLMTVAESYEHYNTKRGRTHIRHVALDDENADIATDLEDIQADDFDMHTFVRCIQHMPDNDTRDMLINAVNSQRYLRTNQLPDWAKLDMKFLRTLSQNTKRQLFSDRNEYFAQHPDELQPNDSGSTTSGTSSLTSNHSQFNPKGPQYPNKQRTANLAQNTTHEDDQASSHDTQAQIDQVIASVAALTERLETANILSVHASVTYYHFTGLTSLDNEWFTVALDNGADTSVLGKGWWIEDYVTGESGQPKFANLVGFDPIMRKRNLPVVSALALFQIGKFKYLLRANQAVYNDEVDLTLLSEFQVKHNNWIVDSTARHHRSYNECGHGLQQMEHIEDDSDAHTVIPFRLRHCLMTFNVREPTAEERQELTPIDITSPAPWHPQDQTDADDPFALRLAQYTTDAPDHNEDTPDTTSQPPSSLN